MEEKWSVVAMALVAWLSPLCLWGQSVDYSMQAISSFSSSNTPFWHLSNRNGLSSMEKDWGYLRVGVKGNYEWGNDWKVEAGVDMMGGYEMNSTVQIQQAYFDLSWRGLRLSIGAKERMGEMKNPLLSTGSLVESSNARPIPQFRIEVPDYVDVFNTHGWLGFRGHVAYGMFTDGVWQQGWAAEGTRYAKNVLYHSKSFFWKVGNEKRFPLTVEGGIQLSAQFGGTIYNFWDRSGNVWDAPVRAKDFLNVFLLQSGDASTSDNDRGNVQGNHLGSYHLSLKWEAEGWSLRGYYEHMFEDHSGMFWEYGLWKDGLVGVEWTRKEGGWLKGVVVEYFNSRDQAGPIYHDSTTEIPDQISTKDDYYENGEYPCWQQYGMNIGSPLITSPLYNENHGLHIYNNRVEAFHVGVNGDVSKEWNYRVLMTYSHDWGSYFTPFAQMKSRFSALVEAAYAPVALKGWGFSLSLACDRGELYGNNSGLLVGICKSGLLWKK